jgi:two-component system sensor histidine kinase PhoQ
VRVGSLSGRLLLASSILLPLFLGITAYGLERSFREAIRAAELEQLKLQSYLLLAAAELEQDRLALPERLSEPRYGELDSGLYARFSDSRGQSVWRSPSARLLTLPSSGPPIPGGASEFGESRIGERSLFHYRYGLVWEATDGADLPFELTLWHDQASYRAQLSSYRKSLLRWLGLAALLLVGLQLVILRWGLRPLSTLAHDLERVEEGAVTRLEGHYPGEVRGVTDNLNLLLASEQGRRERYRNTLADLAHSLKTPLSVLRGALDTRAEPETLRQLCDEQLDRMEQIVSHQLSRAASPGARPPGAPISVAAVIERLVNALRKVYREKQVAFVLDLPADLVFRGDESDLMEMLGNLLDNACKYGGGEVRISAREDSDVLRIRVADDGPGIAPEERSRILHRGARADLEAPGHGIGLAVTREIAAGYGGELRISSRSDVGEFELWLPRASRNRPERP